MFRRLQLMFMCLVAGLAIGPVHALQAQQSQSQSMQRFRVLIPDFQPLNGANKKFGQKAAEKLRDLINTLPTHQPVPKKEMESSLKKYKMKMDQLDCIKTRQLAAQMGAQVALCASYTPGADGQYTVKASFYNMATSEPFNLQDVSAPDKGEQQAAQGIFEQFDRYNQQVRATAFCAQYAQSQQWDAALENCNKALALNPKSAATHYQKAQILFQQKKYEDALAELKTVLSLNPAHDDALKLAGYIAATLGQNQQAEAYYTKYLELNPGSADVRMKIAYDLAKQGDPAGAMQLIQKGLDVAPDNVDLLEQYGGFAFSAGLAVNQKANMNGDDPGSSLTPEAADYFRKAIDAYQKVYSIKGEATPVAHLRNIVAAYVQLNEMDKAIDMAQKALKTHPKEDGLWSMYADALQRAGRVDDAIAALDTVKKLNPEFPNVDLRQGKWLIDAGRVDDAVKVLSTVAQGDSAQARTAAQLIFGDAYTKGVSKKNWSYAITELTAAARLPNLDAGMTHQLNFWHGWSLFQTGMEEQKPGTVASAKASLPKFEEALKLFQNVGDYPRTAAKLDPKKLLDNTNTYIDIQKAIIKRGSRGG
ncbi:MAG: tetratricopeptide repeat protein [Gemmatimonadetes bacterium]|nr:tetratricopeptide repeat protein [Gemmatimonadota bacterium]